MKDISDSDNAACAASSARSGPPNKPTRKGNALPAIMKTTVLPINKLEATFTATLNSGVPGWATWRSAQALVAPKDIVQIESQPQKLSAHIVTKPSGNLTTAAVTACSSTAAAGATSKLPTTELGARNCSTVAKNMTTPEAKNALSVSKATTQSKATSLPAPPATAQRNPLTSGSRKASFMAARVGVSSKSWLVSVRPKAVTTTAIACHPCNIESASGNTQRPTAAMKPRNRTKGRRPCLSEQPPSNGCNTMPSNGDTSQPAVKKIFGTWSLKSKGIKRASHALHPNSGIATATCAAIFLLPTTLHQVTSSTTADTSCDTAIGPSEDDGAKAFPAIARSLPSSFRRHAIKTALTGQRALT
mmetsp:Transcript_110348/g.355844  ORF Transcript_110348/g.355844 Transcript_110348/m.355844 type:complete len:360 (-) Transcript_110348:12-1091(-)